jgi:MFS family permease
MTTVAPQRVTAYPAFVRLWLADAVSDLGTFASALALQLLVIEVLDADQLAVGVVRSAQWLPALLLGAVAGVLIDRVRRRPVLVASDAASALLFTAIGGLALADALTVPVLAVLVFGVGTASIFFNAAHQSLLPGLVPVRLLPAANARVEQASTVAASVGPLVGGALVRVLSAPVVLLANAATFVVSAVLVGTARVEEETPVRSPDRHLGRELREGARWVYRHRTLAPYAVSLHLWFFADSAVMTVLVFFAVRDLGLGPVAVGLVLSCAGVAGVVGAGLAPWAGARFGLGRVCVAADWLTPLAFVPALVAPPGAAGVALLAAGQLLHGFGAGLKGPLDLSHRNAVTPPRLRGRMNATIRSLNWGSIAVSAPLAGAAAAAWGNRPVIAAGVVGLAGAALLLTLSPFRGARMPDDTAAA